MKNLCILKMAISNFRELSLAYIKLAMENKAN